MKYFTFIIFIFLFSCKTRESKIEIANKLINEIRLTKSNSLNKMSNFFLINEKKLKENKEIKFYVNLIQKQTLNKKINIFSYKEFIQKNSFKNYKIIYNHPEDIYCVVTEDDIFITPVIINDNGKIIAFYTGIIKNINRIFPIILKDND